MAAIPHLRLGVNVDHVATIRNARGGKLPDPAKAALAGSSAKAAVDAREEYEEYAETKSDLEGRARMQRNWMAKGVRDSIKKSKDGDKHIKAHNRASSEKQAAKAKPKVAPIIEAANDRRASGSAKSCR